MTLWEQRQQSALSAKLLCFHGGTLGHFPGPTLGSLGLAYYSTGCAVLLKYHKCLTCYSLRVQARRCWPRQRLASWARNSTLSPVPTFSAVGLARAKGTKRRRELSNYCRRLKSAFDFALESDVGCVLFFDEVDSICRKRTASSCILRPQEYSAILQTKMKLAGGSRTNSFASSIVR